MFINRSSVNDLASFITESLCFLDTTIKVTDHPQTFLFFKMQINFVKYKNSLDFILLFCLC